MSFLDNFKTHKVLEVNKSTGIRIGHMLAQTPFVKPATGIAAESVDNGVLFTLNDNGSVKVAAAADTNPLFIHYTEEMQTLGFLNGLKYFTLNYEYGEGAAAYCYPRLIALYSGDTYTTDNFSVTTSGVAGEKPANASEYAFALVKDGAFEVYKAVPAGYTGHVFTAVASTLPDGSDAIEVSYVR